MLFPGKTMLFPGKTIGTYRLDGAVRAPPSPGMEPELLGIVTKLIDGLAGRNRIDVVDDLAYPFPVAVICELLGVPHEDEPRFHAWVEKGMESLDPKLDPTEQQRTKVQVVAKLAARCRLPGLLPGRQMDTRSACPLTCRGWQLAHRASGPAG